MLVKVKQMTQLLPWLHILETNEDPEIESDAIGLCLFVYSCPKHSD